MTDTTPFLVAPYAMLAQVYDRAGYSDYAVGMVRVCLNYAYSELNWAGRRALDVGCGTGLTSIWLAEQGCRVAGVDLSAQMIAQAQQNIALVDDLTFEPPEFVQGDIRQFESPIGRTDLVVAMGGVMNALHSLRDVEAALRHVYAALDPGKPFIFDLRTLRGLASLEREDQGGAYDNRGDLAIFARDRFSFETLSNTRAYTIWQRDADRWQRYDEVHVERGYPLQAIVTLLERSGFGDIRALDQGFEPFDPQVDPHGCAVFVAVRGD